MGFLFKITEFFKNIDFFAVTFEFRINNQNRYGSVLGGIFFILYLFIALSFTGLKFFDWISWTEKKLQHIDVSHFIPPAINMTQSHLIYSTQISFQNDTPVHESHIFPDLFESDSLFSDRFRNKIKILSRICNETDFDGKIKSYALFSKFDLPDLFCYDYYNNFTIQGFFTDKNFSYVEMSLTIKDKYFKNLTLLHDIFSSYSFKYSIFFTNIVPDIESTPINLVTDLHQIYYYLDLNSIQRANIFLQKTTVSEDQNLFFQNSQNVDFHQLSYFENIVTPMNDRSNHLATNKNLLFIIRTFIF